MSEKHHLILEVTIVKSVKSHRYEENGPLIPLLLLLLLLLIKLMIVDDNKRT